MEKTEKAEAQSVKLHVCKWLFVQTRKMQKVIWGDKDQDPLMIAWSRKRRRTSWDPRGIY